MEKKGDFLVFFLDILFFILYSATKLSTFIDSFHVCKFQIRYRTKKCFFIRGEGPF